MPECYKLHLLLLLNCNCTVIRFIHSVKSHHMATLQLHNRPPQYRFIKCTNYLLFWYCHVFTATQVTDLSVVKSMANTIHHLSSCEYVIISIHNFKGQNQPHLHGRIYVLAHKDIASTTYIIDQSIY